MELTAQDFANLSQYVYNNYGFPLIVDLIEII